MEKKNSFKRFFEETFKNFNQIDVAYDDTIAIELKNNKELTAALKEVDGEEYNASSKFFFAKQRKNSIEVTPATFKETIINAGKIKTETKNIKKEVSNNKEIKKDNKDNKEIDGLFF